MSQEVEGRVEEKSLMVINKVAFELWITGDRKLWILDVNVIMLEKIFSLKSDLHIGKSNILIPHVSRGECKMNSSRNLHKSNWQQFKLNMSNKSLTISSYASLYFHMVTLEGTELCEDDFTHGFLRQTSGRINSKQHLVKHLFSFSMAFAKSESCISLLEPLFHGVLNLLTKESFHVDVLNKQSI